MTKIIPDFFRNPATLKLFQSIPNSRHNLRFVGGCVRDALLGYVAKDLDLATSLRPAELMTILDKAKIKYLPTGIEHGTLTIIIDPTIFQVTTLRCDISTDGRRAIVAFTDDWQLDALRRDFTINALSIDITGTIYDYTNGLEDLSNNHLKFIGDPQQRIQEDYLRILRYFRFYLRFTHHRADPKILSIIHQNAHYLRYLSGERIVTELIEILNHPNPQDILQMMIETSVLEQILDITSLPPLWLNLYTNEKQFKNSVSIPWLRRLVALLDGNSISITEAAHKLKLSKNIMTYLFNLANLLNGEKISAFAGIYNFGLSLYQDYLLLTNFTDKQLLWQQAVHYNQSKPIFPIKGSDLIKEGLVPGPHFGQLLEKVRHWWITGNGHATKAACIDYLMKNNSNGS